LFVPVGCSACGKRFQVPEAAIGKPAACPWCQAAVLALPVAAAPATPATDPLSLDDDTPAPTPTQRRPRFIVLALLLIAIVATLTTVAVMRRKEGYLTSREWRAFTPPDNSCMVQLLGRPIEDSSAPESGQRRYLSEGWYSGTTTWLGWRNLSAVEVQIAAAPEAWHNPQLTRLFDQEREWLAGRFGGYVSKDATINFKDPLTREVRLELPDGRGRAVERMIVLPTGPRPRLYFIGIAGKRLDPDGEEVKRLFESFRVNE
jgi:4-amino-4-deoxy-L-arabinose transferase-like glycosyltransferase